MRDRLRTLARWDPPLWLKVLIGLAVFLLAVRWAIVAVVVVVLCLPLIVLSVREKQRRRREGEL